MNHCPLLILEIWRQLQCVGCNKFKPLTLGVLKAIWLAIGTNTRVGHNFWRIGAFNLQAKTLPILSDSGQMKITLEIALQTLCWPKQSLERDAPTPSPLAFKHKPFVLLLIGVPSSPWLHWLEVEQLLKKIPVLSFETWAHWPLCGWYIT